MTTMSEALEKRLSDYLDVEEEARKSGHTLNRLYLVVEALASHLAAHITDDRRQFQTTSEQAVSFGARLTSLEATVEKLRDAIKEQAPPVATP